MPQVGFEPGRRAEVHESVRSTTRAHNGCCGARWFAVAGDPCRAPVWVGGWVGGGGRHSIPPKLFPLPAAGPFSGIPGAGTRCWGPSGDAGGPATAAAQQGPVAGPVQRKAGEVPSKVYIELAEFFSVFFS